MGLVVERRSTGRNTWTSSLQSMLNASRLTLNETLRLPYLPTLERENSTKTIMGSISYGTKLLLGWLWRFSEPNICESQLPRLTFIPRPITQRTRRRENGRLRTEIGHTSGKIGESREELRCLRI